MQSVHPEMPPQAPPPVDLQKLRSVVQTKLMMHFAKKANDLDAACLEWNVRYNGAFRQLLSDASFLELASQVPLNPGEGEPSDELLSRIQDRLEQHIEIHPELVESAGQIDKENEKYLGVRNNEYRANPDQRAA